MIFLWVLAFLVFSNQTSDYDECKPTSSDIKSVIYSKACYNYISPDLLIRIATCESNLNPKAKNKTSTASGIFQFLNSTFINQAQARGLDWTDKNDPAIQAELAARMIADGGIGAWSASKSCWDEKNAY